jgi:nitroimidazol reductase NimA-like FMN-containing flavoprotein (pyridoxamine 5'-phosphate oxidase superfamily)
LPVTSLDPRIAALFTEGRNIVHLASVMPDRAPHSIPLWAILEDGRIAFFTQPTSRKARNVARDPRVEQAYFTELPFRH